MKKVMLSIIIVFQVLISCAQISVWNGTHSMWNNGTGTESDPYLIESAENLAHLAYSLNEGYVTYINSYFKLMIDIDLNNLPWNPIGYLPNESSAKFKGNFDGNNHIITNLYVDTETYAGLFGYVYSTSGIVIKNISIGSNSNISALNDFNCYAGGIIAFAEREVTIKNCHNYGIISGYYAGGIVGKYLPSDFMSIDSCTNNGSILNAHYAGGIIAFIDASNTSVSITNCKNFGLVSADTSGILCCGGIVAIASKIEISNCSNHGEISATNENGSIVVGGIIGYLNKSLINYCYNNGNITGYNNTTSTLSSISSALGGITGRSTLFNTLNQCYNTGNISSLHFSNPKLNTYTGGIIGFDDLGINLYPFTSLGGAGLDSNIDINNCYNTGTLFSTPNPTNNTLYNTGGIVGYSEGYDLVTAKLYVNNSYNAGSLINGGQKGGIYGGSSTWSWEIITNCYYLNECGDNTDFDGEPKTENEMKEIEFVNTLNFDTDVWSQDIEPYLNLGYPLFYENNRFPIVITTEATSIAGNSVILNGHIFEKNETISTYGFEYKQNSSENDFIQTNSVTNFSDLSELVTNLETNTIYSFRAFAITVSGITYGDTLSFTTLSTVGVPNNDENHIISIYPNPFYDRININLKENILQSFSVFIYGQNGSMVYSKQDLVNSEVISLDFLKLGTYTLILIAEDGYIKTCNIIKAD